MSVAERRKASYHHGMADENGNKLLEEEELVVAPVTPGHSFAPLIEEAIAVAAEAESGPSKAPETGPPSGVPTARVDPEPVKKFEHEIDEKITTGRRRMRWFANHLILFDAGVVGEIPLRLTVFNEYHDAFFWCRWPPGCGFSPSMTTSSNARC